MSNEIKPDKAGVDTLKVSAVAWLIEGPYGPCTCLDENKPHMRPEEGVTFTGLYTAQQFLELAKRAMPEELSTERFAAMFADGHSAGCHQFLTTLTTQISSLETSDGGEMEKGK